MRNGSGPWARRRTPSGEVLMSDRDGLGVHGPRPLEKSWRVGVADWARPGAPIASRAMKM